MSYQNVNYFCLRKSGFIKHTDIKHSFFPPSLKVCFFTAVFMTIKLFAWKPLLPLLAKSGAFWVFSAFSLALQSLLQLLLAFFLQRWLCILLAVSWMMAAKVLTDVVRSSCFSVGRCCLNRSTCKTGGEVSSCAKPARIKEPLAGVRRIWF